MKQNVLVTGASGFLGKHLITELNKTADVVALSRTRFEGEAVESIAVDLVDMASLRDALQDHEFDAVFHLGAQSITGSTQGGETIAANVMGTVNLLELITDEFSGARLVCASTTALEHVAAGSPLTTYAASKQCMEIICQSYIIERGLDIVIARLTNIYGPGDVNLSRIVPGTITSVLENRPPDIRSHLDTRLNQLYVDDAVRALCMLAHFSLDDEEERSFTICNTREYTLGEIIATILQRMDRIDLAPDTIGKHVDRRQSLQPSQRLLKEGWNAATTIDAGIEATIDWYNKHYPDYAETWRN